MGFAVTALLSLAYFLAYFFIYRNPSKDPKLSPVEYDYIVKGGGTPEDAASAGQGHMLGYLLHNRKVWGLTIGFSAYGYTFYLFLTWLPGYIAQTMHMNPCRRRTAAPAVQTRRRPPASCGSTPIEDVELREQVVGTSWTSGKLRG